MNSVYYRVTSEKNLRCNFKKISIPTGESRWDNVRYKIEEHMGLHKQAMRKDCTNYICARIALKNGLPDDSRLPPADNDVIDSDTLLIVSRRQNLRRQLPYVPVFYRKPQHQQPTHHNNQTISLRPGSEESRLQQVLAAQVAAPASTPTTTQSPEASVASNASHVYRTPQFHPSCGPSEHYTCMHCGALGLHYSENCTATLGQRDSSTPCVAYNNKRTYRRLHGVLDKDVRPAITEEDRQKAYINQRGQLVVLL